MNTIVHVLKWLCIGFVVLAMSMTLSMLALANGHIEKAVFFYEKGLPLGIAIMLYSVTVGWFVGGRNAE